MKSLFTLTIALASSALVSAALAQDASDAPGGLVIYNAQHQSLTKEWTDAFTKETGIKVTVRDGGDSEFANQIVAEADLSPADIFLTENSPAMAQVEAAGLFAPVDADTLAQVPEQFRPASGKWIGIAARSTVFAYDKTKLSEDKLPKSLVELADPAWNGRWAASPAGADFQAIVSALLELKGEEATAAWLKGMKANFKPYRGNSTVMKAVNAGQIEGGVIYHYYWFGDQAKTGENSGNVGLHYFRNQDPGAFVSISGGGVLATSKHPKEAQAFLKWVSGKGGQEILKNGTSFEYAVGNGAASNPKLVPLDQLDAPKVEPSKLNSPKVIELMNAAGIL
ncbi:iron ABC transporter substrate-binding protein [Mesorhizobium sp. RP14(2022)]|uniref:Iron ABC transporter substrate-binding protein n=1 Tax=Mesorhizobium liriopis TaxID=2953882 RepID=A0ABT1C1K6_9HYPH|nr:iron ABC transporter substrate-binding protein [Mesorhizobium liriopis]MCO6048702.1 iron ABC transporter substrate-binding protein [Mesorhizobium liriopis]